MATFRLDLDPPMDEAAALSAGFDGLTKVVLLHNARWFTRIRWLVVAVLTGFTAVAALLGAQRLEAVGIRPVGAWPVYLAAVLAMLNLISLGWLRRLSARASERGVAANIWFQIVTDLTVLTVLVYRIGATETVVVFAYLFHITLACIFFGRRDSFVVTTLSAALFLAIVWMECATVLPRASILLPAPSEPLDSFRTALFAVPAVFVWFVVWHLVSTLSGTVRRRDRELDAANKRILRADEQINRQMLRVTHDLKAPFSGIESNIQILKQVHCAEMPEPVRAVIEKIDTRSATLRSRISDILMLGSLRSSEDEARKTQPVRLRDLLESVVRDVLDPVNDKQVSLNLAAHEATVHTDTKQLKILFSNLISNAVIYSHEGGTIDIGIEEEAARLCVSVVDHGIGISDKTLPRVFEDFFRAEEAASFNPKSTGLGLAIVRQIARNLRLAITVDSEQGKGTTFRVFIPKDNDRKETRQWRES